MKHIVAIFLILAFSSMPVLGRVDALGTAVQQIEAEWARIHYKVAKKQRSSAFERLLVKVDALNKQYPDQAEVIIQQAIIVASNADNISALEALSAIHQARDLLLQAIALDPNASEGAAFVTLGSLYYRVPGWPIAYGDDNKAREMLKKALTINPNSIDANYFYGDFLAVQGEQKQAVIYFKRAMAIPVRASQAFADTQLHQQAKLAMIKNRQSLTAHKQGFSVAYGEK